MPHAPQIDFTERDTHRFFEDIKTLIKRKIISDDFTDYYGNFFDEISSMGRLANDMPGHLLRHGRYFFTHDYYLSKYMYSSASIKSKPNYVDAPPVEIRFSEHAENQMCFFISLCEVLLNPHLKLYAGFVESRYFHMWLFDEEQNSIVEPTPLARNYYYGIEIRDIAALVEYDLCEVVRAAKIDMVTAKGEDRVFYRRIRRLANIALENYEATKAK